MPESAGGTPYRRHRRVGRPCRQGRSRRCAAVLDKILLRSKQPCELEEQHVV